jgi:hypothetical protein
MPRQVVRTASTCCGRHLGTCGIRRNICVCRPAARWYGVCETCPLVKDKLEQIDVYSSKVLSFPFGVLAKFPRIGRSAGSGEKSGTLKVDVATGEERFELPATAGLFDLCEREFDDTTM